MPLLQRLVQAAASGEYHIRLSGNHAFSEQLLAAPKARRPSPHGPAPYTLLVTGGTKGLGLEFAKQKLREGAQNAVLLSRDPALAKEDLVRLAEGGKAVFTVSCNASSSQAIAEVAAWAREWLPCVQASFKSTVYRCYGYSFKKL